MAYEIQNAVRRSSILRVIGAGTVTIPLASFSANSTIETVSSIRIGEVFWSTSGSITITRGGVDVLSLHGSGHMSLQASGILLSNTSTGNVAVTIATACSCILECVKEADYSPALS